MKADRLMSIILLLSEHPLLSATKLAEILEVSPRTIYRDVDTLSMAGLPIYTTTGKQGGIGILDSYKIDKNVLDINDISTLLIGLNSLQRVLPNQSLLPTSLKIKNLIDEQHRNQVEDLFQQLKIDPSPWNENKTMSTSFHTIQLAIRQKKKIRFAYCDRIGTDMQRSAEPYRLVHKSNHWYVQAYCLDRNAFRTFKLERMSNVEGSQESYIHRKMPTELSNNVNFQEETIAATLRVKENIMRKILLDHGKDCVLSRDGDTFTVQITLSLNDWGYQYILGFGEDCECLAPLSLREKIVDKVKTMYLLYNKS